MTPADAGTVRRFLDVVRAGIPVAQPVQEWATDLPPVTSITTYCAGDLIVEQNAPARAVHFLIAGTLAYEHLVADADRG